jgi:hypothetical protein
LHNSDSACLFACRPVTNGADRFLAAFSRAGIGPRALAAHWQLPLVALAAVTANGNQAADILGDLTPQIAFNYKIFLQRLRNLCDLRFGQVAGVSGRVNLCPAANLFGSRRPDAVNIPQPNVETLFVRNVHTKNTWHCQRFPLLACANGPERSALPLFMPDIRADDANNPVPLDDAAVLAQAFY